MLLLSFPFCKDQGAMPGTASVTLALGVGYSPSLMCFWSSAVSAAQQDYSLQILALRSAPVLGLSVLSGVHL